MNLSERVYKVGSIFIQNGDFDVTVGKRDAKRLERDRSDVIVATKNSLKRASKTGLSKHQQRLLGQISLRAFHIPL